MFDDKNFINEVRKIGVWNAGIDDYKMKRCQIKTGSPSIRLRFLDAGQQLHLTGDFVPNMVT